MAALLKKGIQSRPFFNQLSKLPAYSDEPQSMKAISRNKVSAYLAPKGINLPSALSLTEKHVDYVCEALKEILKII